MKHYVILATFCTAVTVIPQVARAGEKPDGPSSTGSAETTTSQLDSRNLPRPEWTQVSGEVEKKKTLVHEGEPDRLIVTLKAIEGGMLQADLGDAEQLNKVELQDHDYIHVRGRMVTQGTHQVLIAGELIADGKVIRINRNDWEVRQDVWQDNKEGEKGSLVPTTPAAPQPKR